jgi:hypothetical protein
MTKHTLTPVLFFDAIAEVERWSDEADALATATLDLTDPDVMEAEIAARVADVCDEVRDNLAAEIRATWNPGEQRLLEQLLAGRHVWLDAHFRDELTGATTPHPACLAADRIWAAVQTELRIHA